MWLLNDEPPNEDDPVLQVYGDMEPIISLPAFRTGTAHERRKIISEAFSFSSEMIQQIAHSTKEQWKSKEFCILRKYRLTASKFGIIIAAVGRNSFPKSFWERVLETKTLDGVIIFSISYIPVKVVQALTKIHLHFL